MRVWTLAGCLLAYVPPAATAAVPPGRQHLLTIEGENTVTFVPQARVAPFKIDYTSRVEYVVNTRTGAEAVSKGEAAAVKALIKKKSAAAAKAKKKDKGKDAEPAGAATPGGLASAVDVSIHSTESRFRQNGQTVVESKMSRSRFQGRLLPETPVLSVSAADAPPKLQEFLRTFDTTAATVLLDDDSRVIGRRLLPEGPLHALTETLLSIQTPIPRYVASWEAPTQLAMGHGQTARGKLRFEKDKESVGGNGGLVRVKVSGVLRAEGAVAGKFIKDGTYTVTGEQSYDPESRSWTTARWSVAVNNELANPNGQTVARALGTMLVRSQALDGPPASGAPAAAPGAQPPR